MFFAGPDGGYGGGQSMTPDELEAAFARHIEDGRRLAVIRKIYRQHRERPPISAAFIAD
jgi:hypothetical protein